MDTTLHEDKAAAAYILYLAENHIHKDDSEGYDWELSINGEGNYFDPFSTLEDAEQAMLKYIDENANCYDGSQSYDVEYRAVSKDRDDVIYCVEEEYNDSEACEEQWSDRQHQEDCQHIARYGY